MVIVSFYNPFNLSDTVYIKGSFNNWTGVNISQIPYKPDLSNGYYEFVYIVNGIENIRPNSISRTDSEGRKFNYILIKNGEIEVDHLHEAVAKGDTMAMIQLGIYHLRNNNIRSNASNFEHLYGCLNVAAERGNTWAMYLQGKFACKWSNDPIERKYFRRAARLGNPLAMCELGKNYADAVQKSPLAEIGKMFKWFNEAINAEYIPALYELGKYYYNNKDYTNAVKYFTEAANKGNTDALRMLGKYYSEINEESAAINWWTLSINNGNNRACEDLGNWYLQKKKREDALKWFNFGLERGYEQMHKVLGDYHTKDKKLYHIDQYRKLQMKKTHY